MNIIIRDKLYLDRNQFDEAVLRSHFTFDNPDYARNIRLGFSNYRTPRFICLVGEQNGHVTLPRGTIQQLRFIYKGIQLIDETNTAPFVFPPSQIKLRDYQIEPVEKILQKNQGFLIAPPGSGKTVIAIETLLRRGQKTLILCHTRALVDQWVDRLRTFGGVEVGIMDGQTQIVKPVTVSTPQTARNMLSPEFVNQWGYVIVDECHHVPAVTFREVVDTIPARYRLGLTATPKRQDGLEFVLSAVIGNVIHEIEDVDDTLKPTVRVIETNFVSTMDDYGKMLSEIIRDEERNELILSHLIPEAEAGHSVLVLSRRVAHVEHLHRELLTLRPQIPSAVVVGSTAKKEREEILEKVDRGEIWVLFSCLIADEGLDLKILDRLFIVVPSRSIQRLRQQIGRIQRAHPQKRDCVVFDFRDRGCGLAESQFKSRYYKLYRRFDD